jgi:hypothetical protein
MQQQLLDLLTATRARARLYGAWAACLLRLGATSIIRMITGTRHPKDWPLAQECSVLMMRTLFDVGGYTHWRRFIRFTVSAARAPELLLTRVPRDTFISPGCRNSWWVELVPELRPQPCRASLVLLYLHGAKMNFCAPPE